MGVEPPFIYDRPSTYTFSGPTERGFNPRAATQASWAPPPPKPTQDGHLIDFNKHPDSYVALPYGNLNVTPMNPNTKDKVKIGRRVQLFLRLCALVGALGSLFCVIVITKTSTAAGWIIRVGPAVSLLHAVYAIYNLSRSVNSRTTATTASYMLFAAMTDVGLIAFYTFSALIARSDYTTNEYGWSTMFHSSEKSYTVIFAFFLICVIEGGLLLLSIGVGIYLFTIFKKIARLPPDMNPLEPNLTARPHHKRHKSELVSEKHLSGSTMSSDGRMSMQADPLISGTRRVPFIHTRTDSADSFTSYGNNSPRNSRVALEQKEHSEYRKSQLSQDINGVSRPVSAVNPSPNSRAAGAGLSPNSSRSPLPAQGRRNKTPSWLSYVDFEGVPRAVSGNAAQILNAKVQAPAAVSQQSPPRPTSRPMHTEGKNWYSSPPRNPRISHTPTTPESNLRPLQQKKKRSREPLGMNPPTPRVQQMPQDENTGLVQAERGSYLPTRNILQDAELNTVTSRPEAGSRGSSFVGSGGKSKYYGNLRRSISSLTSVDHQRAAAADDIDMEAELASHPRPTTAQSAGSHLEVHGVDDEDEFEDEPLEETSALAPVPTTTWQGARKTSNSTGYDLQGGYAGLGSEFGRGMGRRREVSGKVAEEGRSGQEINTDHPQAQMEAHRGGAAGWARFKGM